MAKRHEGGGKLRIVHVLRAPLGGLFRHVLDLTREQIARGHQVGLITDSLTGGANADTVLEELRPRLALGLVRLPIQRLPHPSDVSQLLRIDARLRRPRPDVIHGHGSKGGTFARLPGLLPFHGRAIRAYTPHGGSFNYKPGSAVNRAYMAAERVLASGTDLFLFESAYIARRFREDVGATPKLTRIVLNGISEAELIPVQPNETAADFVYVGEWRSAKGIDTLIDALALISKRYGIVARLVLVGSGPDEAILYDRAAARDVREQIQFVPPMRARDAFRLGRAMVVPSRQESLPYIVLEAAGARIPMVATNVGGIPEIFGPYRDRLIPSDDPGALADALHRTLTAPAEELRIEADQLAAFVGARFSLSGMADDVIAAYLEALANKSQKPKLFRVPFALPS
ncbi:MAG: glycosyltransferase family 4 protein [Methylobacteriaceae bacterium]|nr:glycosyltransferase family 4 protein [Methylobacteriaceae bacterium]